LKRLHQWLVKSLRDGDARAALEAVASCRDIAPGALRGLYDHFAAEALGSRQSQSAE
jgi:hypothetical protein